MMQHGVEARARRKQRRARKKVGRLQGSFHHACNPICIGRGPSVAHGITGEVESVDKTLLVSIESAAIRSPAPSPPDTGALGRYNPTPALLSLPETVFHAFRRT